MLTASQKAQAARYQGLANKAAGVTRGQRADAARYSGLADAAGASREPSRQALSSFINQGLFSYNKNNISKPTGKPPVYKNPDPGTFKAGPDPDPYPAVLPSLSARELGELAQRRQIADQRLKEAEADKERGTTLLEASAARARQSAERDSRRSIEDFMRQAAGRGVARSPMVAGRRQRRLGEDLRLEVGEIDTRLSTEIATLQDMVSKAENARSQEIAFIKQDEVNMRTDLERLFPASQMYG
jgi:hypothetical protein